MGVRRVRLYEIKKSSAWFDNPAGFKNFCLNIEGGSAFGIDPIQESYYLCIVNFPNKKNYCFTLPINGNNINKDDDIHK